MCVYACVLSAEGECVAPFPSFLTIQSLLGGVSGWEGALQMRVQGQVFLFPGRTKMVLPKDLKIQCLSIWKTRRSMTEVTPPFSAVSNPVYFTSVGRNGSQCPCVGGMIRNSPKKNVGWCSCCVVNYLVLSLQGPSVLEGIVFMCRAQW